MSASDSRSTPPAPAALDSVARLKVLETARRLLRAEADAVSGLIPRIDSDFLQAVELLVACTRRGGAVLVTGLGKSGLIGAKVSATLASLGLPSHFIHPVEAAHGDLGNFRETDLCIALSNSGETDEVLSLVACLRQDGIDVIGICAGADPEAERSPVGQSERSRSRLERLSSVSLTTGRVDQRFGSSPAPMCSTTASLALGDALALCASQLLEFSHADFAKRHPGGSLGGLLKPVVEALRFVVGKNLIPVPDDMSVDAALRHSETAQRRPGAMLLVSRETGELTGIFTDADLRRLILKDPGLMARPVGTIMSRSPSSLPDTARLADAVYLVQQFRRDEIPVVDAQGRPVGMLDVQDLIAMRLVQD